MVFDYSREYKVVHDVLIAQLHVRATIIVLTIIAPPYPLILILCMSRLLMLRESGDKAGVMKPHPKVTASGNLMGN